MSDRQRHVGYDDLGVATGAILDGAEPACDGSAILLALAREQGNGQPSVPGGRSGFAAERFLRALPRPEDEEDWEEEDDDDEDDEDDEELEEDDQEDWEYDWEEGDEEDEGGEDEEEW